MAKRPGRLTSVGSPAPRSVSTTSATTSMTAKGGQGGPGRTTPASGRRTGGGPAGVPAQMLRVAQDDVAAAEGALAVAAAKLSETVAAAPRVSPRVTAAEAAVRKGREAADKAAQAVGRAMAVVLDAEGDVEVAEAVAGEKSAAAATPSAAVSARTACAQKARALDAARDAVVDAQERQAEVEAQLTGLQEALEEARADVPAGSSVLVAARVSVQSAERRLASTQIALEAAHRAAVTAADDDDDGDQPVVPEFASVDAFVEDYVLLNWRHQLAGTKWCAYWWCHAEAMSRLEACWEAFEVMRLEPAPALSTWWRDHLDVHMRALTAPEGTFAACLVSRHEEYHAQEPVWAAHPTSPGTFETDPLSPRQPKRVLLAQASAVQAAVVQGSSGAGRGGPENNANQGDEQRSQEA